MTTKIPEELINSGSATDGYVLTADGSGGVAWEAAAGGGALVYISTATASNSDYLEFTSGIDSTYDNYVFIGSNLVGEDDGGADSYFQATLSKDGGSNYVTADDSYIYEGTYKRSNATTISSYYASTTALTKKISMTFGAAPGNVGGEHISFIGTLKSPSSTSLFKVFEHEIAYYDTSSILYREKVTASLNTTDAVNAIRFQAAASKIVSGTIKMYGVKKS